MQHDKRSHARVPIDVEARCERAAGAPFQGFARDISIGGVFIESEESVAFAEELTIVLRLPGAKTELRLPAIVRWTKPGGFGVQFGLLGARETHALSELKRS